MPSTRPERVRLRGRDVALALIGATLATAVVPPLAASRLAHSRVAAAAATAEKIASTLRAERMRGGLTEHGAIVCGPGRLPMATDAGRAWVAAPTTNADLFGPSRPTDPWGRCYLVNLSALASGQPVLVISAGANSLIDTAVGAREPSLDDVAVRVW